MSVFLRPSSSLLLSTTLSLLLKDLYQVAPDDIRALRCVQTCPNALLLVVSSYRIRLLVISLQTLAESLGVVVTSLN